MSSSNAGFEAPLIRDVEYRRLRPASTVTADDSHELTVPPDRHVATAEAAFSSLVEVGHQHLDDASEACKRPVDRFDECVTVRHQEPLSLVCLASFGGVARRRFRRRLLPPFVGHWNQPVLWGGKSGKNSAKPS